MILNLESMKLLLASCLYASLSAQTAWAQLTIHVTPTASPQTTLADLKKNPNAPVTLTQALAPLKDPALRDVNGALNENITIHLDARGKAEQKASTDDPNGTLRKRLAGVRYNQSPYKERYPNLANILNDEPGAPKYNIARRNHFDGDAAVRDSKDAEAGISIENSNQFQIMKLF